MISCNTLYFSFQMHPLLLILLLTTMTSPQTIEIHDLTRNPGLLALQTGNTLIKTGRHRIYHAIDLDDYQPLLTNIKITLDGLRIFSDFNDVNTLLRTKFENVNKLYRKLLPRTRTRRGAFNFLGSTIKLITGNLDEDDLVQINNDINDLKQNNHNLIRQNNIQVTINKHLEDRINNIINVIHDQQKITKQHIIAARQSSINNRAINHNFTIFRQIFKISYHVDMLQHHLESIFEVIQLAKINLISKNFLETAELDFIIARLEEQNVTILNPDQAYDYLDIRAFFKGATLYFIIGVPQISSNLFNSLLLEPLPINGRNIKIPWNRAATNGNLTYFIKGNCQHLGENTLCNENELEDISDDECFSKIIHGSHGSCMFTSYQNMTNIKRLTDNYIIIKNTSASLLTDCQFGNRTLSGTFLIYYTNCSISIGGKSFNTVEFSIKPKPIIIPLDGVKIQQNEFEPNLDIQSLSKLHIHNRQQLQNIDFRHTIQTSASLGLSSVCIILGITIILYIRCSKTPKPEGPHLDINIQEQTTADPKDKDQTMFVSGRSKLEGEAVNTGNSTIDELIQYYILPSQQNRRTSDGHRPE